MRQYVCYCDRCNAETLEHHLVQVTMKARDKHIRQLDLCPECHAAFISWLYPKKADDELRPLNE